VYGNGPSGFETETGFAWQRIDVSLGQTSSVNIVDLYDLLLRAIGGVSLELFPLCAAALMAMAECSQCGKDFEHCQCSTRLVTGIPTQASSSSVYESESEYPGAVAHATQINGYRNIRVLGRGASSAVFLAEKLSIAKNVAIKVLYPSHQLDERAVKRFEFEARALSNLDHPNIVKVFDIGIADDGMPFIVMDFIDGPDLKSIITEQGTLQPERAINVFAQLCDALSCAHERGIVHRDLKPGNVVIVRDWKGDDVVKLVDFGIAKPIHAGGELQRLTQTGEMLGSPAYMSPEQIRSDDTDVRSDIYSLGCVMYEALTGRPPFRGESIIKTLTMHLEDFARPPADINPRLAKFPALSAAVIRCLAKDKEDRPGSAKELKSMLAGPGPANGDGSQRKILYWVIAAFFVSLAANAFLLLFPQTGLKEEPGTVMNRDTASSAGAPPKAVSNAVANGNALIDSQKTYDSLLELARAQLIWYSGRKDESLKSYESAMKIAIEENAPVSVQLAVGSFLVDAETGLDARNRLYQRLKPLIDGLVEKPTSGMESLFAANILWYLGDDESGEAQDLRRSNRAESDRLAQSSLRHLEAALFLAKSRKAPDARGLIAKVSKDLGIIHAFRGDLRAARENYKRAVDSTIELQGPGSQDAIDLAKLLGCTSLALYRSERHDASPAGKMPAYLVTTRDALKMVLHSSDSPDSELRSILNSLESLR